MIEMQMVSLKAVIHEIDATTNPAETAPGNKSGTIHAHKNFVKASKIPKPKMTTPMMIAIPDENKTLFFIKSPF